MYIYLLRHAVAVNRADVTMPNDDRPLTKDGREKMEKAAQGIVRLMASVPEVILTSPLSRARDTAMIAAEAMKCVDHVVICQELSPGNSIETLLEALGKHAHREQIMLVGHAPDLNFTASTLLGSEIPIIELKKGGLCCIEITSLTGKRQGTLQWLLQPKQLRQLAKDGA